MMNNVKNKLSVATCSLLGSVAPQAEAVENAWDLDSSFLFYSEADDRVTVRKLIALLTGDISNEDTVNVNLVLDTMSGATPTGAVRSKNSSVSFSSASGAGSSTIDGASVDRVNFSDTRLGIALSWAHMVNRLSTLNYGGSLSVEKDYQSYGLSIGYNRDTEDRLTTYTLGFAGSFDQIFRKTNGTPKPLSRVSDAIIFSDGERFTYDFIMGISKVLNRKTVAQLNYTLGYSDGYHTDPYKVISEVNLIEDTATGEFAFAELDRYYESRPDTRLRHAIFTSVAHQYGDSGETVHASYRFYTDDWGVSSNTFDLTHRTPLFSSSYIEPHFRYYQQSAADFFVHSFINEDVATPIVLPQYASADYRLDAAVALTAGIEYGMKLSSGTFRTRLEFINWQYEAAEYDETKALVFQISYQKLFY